MSFQFSQNVPGKCFIKCDFPECDIVSKSRDGIELTVEQALSDGWDFLSVNGRKQWFCPNCVDETHTLEIIPKIHNP